MFRCVRNVAADLVALVAPPPCLACGRIVRSGLDLCPSCSDSMPVLGFARCARCAAVTVQPVDSCRECHGRSFGFDRCRAPVAYHGPARDLVHALKYRSCLGAAVAMAGYVAADSCAEWVGRSFVPVPAARRRTLKRGFNPALVLAKALVARSGGRIDDCLCRSRAVSTQVGLPRGRRLRNQRGTVTVRRSVGVPADPILVDDVYTTGATLNECARVLKGAGSLTVSGLVFARSVAGLHIDHAGQPWR